MPQSLMKTYMIKYAMTPKCRLCPQHMFHAAARCWTLATLRWDRIGTVRQNLRSFTMTLLLFDTTAHALSLTVP